MQIASAKSRSTRGVSHEPAFTGNCLAITYPCLPCLSSRWVNPCVLCPTTPSPPRFDWLNGGSVDVLLCMLSTVLVLWGVGAILGNGTILKDNIILHSSGRKKTAELHYRNRILDIKCFKLTAMNVYYWPNA